MLKRPAVCARCGKPVPRGEEKWVTGRELHPQRRPSPYHLVHRECLVN
jgi:hypothetical protein